jgi:hypothetical protein
VPFQSLKLRFSVPDACFRFTGMTHVGGLVWGSRLKCVLLMRRVRYHERLLPNCRPQKRGIATGPAPRANRTTRLKVRTAFALDSKAHQLQIRSEQWDEAFCTGREPSNLPADRAAQIGCSKLTLLNVNFKPSFGMDTTLYLQVLIFDSKQNSRRTPRRRRMADARYLAAKAWLPP